MSMTPGKAIKRVSNLRSCGVGEYFGVWRNVRRVTGAERIIKERVIDGILMEDGWINK